MLDFCAGTVYFAGAGPGDVDLLTLKARRLIERADLVLYSGSLVNPLVLDFARPQAERLDTAGMKLEEQVACMTAAAQAGKVVARLHTGDPSVFGAIEEQMRGLRAAGVPYQIIPGVSAAFAAAAALGIEFTLPESTQSVIFTRMAGRTPVPSAERLRDLAAHHTSLVIFLSTGLISEVTEELRAAGYPAETPVALVYRVSWPDEHILRGTLADIAIQAEAQELTHQGLIVVSPALAVGGTPTASHLYGGFQTHAETRQGTGILALTAPAVDLARRLRAGLPGQTWVYLPARLARPEDAHDPQICLFQESIRQALQRAFERHTALVCILASGIVVRELAPLLKNKHSDPAVVVMDAQGRFAVSLLSGHAGGANRLAQQLAGLTGGQAVITTASDVQAVAPALDVLARERGWKEHPRSALAAVMAAVVNGEKVAAVQDAGLEEWAQPFQTYASIETAWQSGAQALALLTYHQPPPSIWQAFSKVAVYYPPCLVVGVGCNRGTSAQEIETAIRETLQDAGLALESVACLATVVEKTSEEGLRAVAERYAWPLRVVSHAQIQTLKDLPNPSPDAQRALGVPGVAEPAALWVAGSSELLVEKQKFANVTVAVALRGAGAEGEEDVCQARF